MQYFTKWTLGPVLGLGPQISSIIMTNYQHCTRESVLKEAHYRFHRRTTGPTWDLGPKFQETINRTLTKHHYKQTINSVKHYVEEKLITCNTSLNGPYGPSCAVDPNLLNTLKVPLPQCTYDKPSTLYKKICRSKQFVKFHK